VILVVEDDEDTRKMLLDALNAGMDARVTTAANGQAALDVIALQPPALVLLDLNLPAVHGLEVVRRLKANPGSAAIPVVALTAHGRDPGGRAHRGRASCAGAGGRLRRLRGQAVRGRRPRRPPQPVAEPTRRGGRGLTAWSLSPARATIPPCAPARRRSRRPDLRSG
jgi:CheY-like chemotaxis protein